MNDVTFLEQVTVTEGFGVFVARAKFPSTVTTMLFGLSGSIVILEVAGKTMERKTVSEQIGVKTMAAISGSMTGPPAESE
jgi:hypothetical protein